MTEPSNTKGVIVPPTATDQQMKAQLRLAVAAIAGALVLHHLLPAWLVNDQTVEVATGIAMYGAMSAWAWARQKLIHSRFWKLAIDPKVPNDAIRPADPPS